MKYPKMTALIKKREPAKYENLFTPFSFAPIGLKQALDEIAGHVGTLVKRFGPDTIAGFLGTTGYFNVNATGGSKITSISFSANQNAFETGHGAAWQAFDARLKALRRKGDEREQAAADWPRHCAIATDSRMTLPCQRRNSLSEKKAMASAR